MSRLTRRAFIATGLGAFAALVAATGVACARGERTDKPHPDPRPGDIRAAIDRKFK